MKCLRGGLQLRTYDRYCDNDTKFRHPSCLHVVLHAFDFQTWQFARIWLTPTFFDRFESGSVSPQVSPRFLQGFLAQCCLSVYDSAICNHHSSISGADMSMHVPGLVVSHILRVALFHLNQIFPRMCARTTALLCFPAPCKFSLVFN